MRILGVDPGSRVVGWGVIQRAGTRLQHIAHGTITATGDNLAERLLVIDDRLDEVIAAHQPDEAAVETIFYSKNAQSAAKLGHARGVVLLRLVRQGLVIHEYSPARIKRAVAGSGRADKRQVAMVVKALLGLPEPPPSDAADALAMALTHLNVSRFEQAIKRS